MKTIEFLLSFLLFFSNGNLNVFGQAKLISVPQVEPDTRLLKNNYSIWEKTLPFEGLSIGFNSNIINNKTSSGYFGKGEDELCSSVFKSNKLIKYDDYTNSINDLRNCKFQKFKNNFIILSVFNINWSRWEDDLAWGGMISNLEVAAKIAHDSGLRGIILDAENYGSPQNLNLVFYCQQFVKYIYHKDSKTAYIRIKDIKDQNTLDDLFPRKGDLIYWKDIDDVANNIKLTKVFLDIYKDDKNNYYYPLLDPIARNDIKIIVEKVEARGKQIVLAITKNFPKAEIILTIGPSYVREVLNNIYGLTYSNNYLRTGYGLLIPFTKGMLKAIETTNAKLIDGQEQTYYHKTSGQFENSHKNFEETSNYFEGEMKYKYLNNMNEAIGLYPRPASANNGNNERFFTEQDIVNTFRYATALKEIKYVWVWEEEESYWFMPTLKSLYLNKSERMSKIGGKDFDKLIKNINSGIHY